MPNKHYESGRRFEYRIKNHLERIGYYVIRSAGSKGIADLVAIIPVGNHSKVFLIQVKTGNANINAQEKQILIEKATQLNAIPVLVRNINHKMYFVDLRNERELDMKYEVNMRDVKWK